METYENESRFLTRQAFVAVIMKTSTVFKMERVESFAGF